MNTTTLSTFPQFSTMSTTEIIEFFVKNYGVFINVTINSFNRWKVTPINFVFDYPIRKANKLFKMLNDNICVPNKYGFSDHPLFNDFATITEAYEAAFDFITEKINDGTLTEI